MYYNVILEMQSNGDKTEFFLNVSHIKCRIAMAKAAFNKKRTVFTSTLDLELRKKLVKCYVWSIALWC